MKKLTFVTLLAYDYKYAYMALRSYYDIADEIILGVDADRLTWMRRPLEIDMDEVRAFIADLDKDRKIRVVEGNFHTDESPMANEVLERSLLSTQAAPGNWVVQIDADEILVNGTEFREWLLSTDPAGCDVLAQWIIVFKAFGDQVLLVDPPGESVAVATMARGQYRLGRYTGQPTMMSPLKLLHLSWGRTPQELMQKLTNWGHAKDFDVHAFYRFWESVNPTNYAQAKNFHPLAGETWPSLKLVTLEGVAGT